MITDGGTGQKKRRPSRGQALVEFALVIPIFLLLLIALFDLGRAVFAYNTLTNAAREGARLAIVNQDKPSVVARAQGQTAIVELDSPSVDVKYYQVAVDGSPDQQAVSRPGRSAVARETRGGRVPRGGLVPGDLSSH